MVDIVVVLLSGSGSGGRRGDMRTGNDCGGDIRAEMTRAFRCFRYNGTRGKSSSRGRRSRGSVDDREGVAVVAFESTAAAAHFMLVLELVVVASKVGGGC